MWCLFPFSPVLLLIVLGWISAGAVFAVEAPSEPVSPNDPILATFDGGTISLVDLDAKAASRWRLIQRGTREEARTREERIWGGREELVKELAAIRILAGKAMELGLALDATREASMNREMERILAGIYFSRLVEPEVEEARKRHPQVYLDYYQDHLKDFMEPALWSFRYIFIGPPQDPPADGQAEGRSAPPEKPELSPQEKAEYRARAEKVYRLCQAGGDFEALAKQYSAMPEAHRGELRGPTTATLYAPEVASALQRLATGQLSPIIEAKHGFLILYCENFSPERPAPFEEVLPKIKEKAPRFMPEKVYREVEGRILEEHPLTLHAERLSVEAEKADELVVEGDRVRLYNRDIVTSSVRQRAAALDLELKELESIARQAYTYRLKAELARQAGIAREPLGRRAIQLAREFAWHNQLLSHMTEHPVSSIPSYTPPWPEYRQRLLEQYHFRFIEESESSETPEGTE